MTPGAAGMACPVTAGPAPRFTPAPARTLRDPAVRGRGWPDRWPLRTYLELAALDTAPGSARAHVRAILREWHADDDTAHAAAQVVTELLTNAIETTWEHRRHDPVRLWMLGDTRSVLLLVWDATMPAPVLAVPAPGDENGRGLALVNHLSEQWGYYHPAEQSRGKVVWAVLRVPSVPRDAQSAPPLSRMMP
jgi:two-component sensor histidine kinase